MMFFFILADINKGNQSKSNGSNYSFIQKFSLQNLLMEKTQNNSFYINNWFEIIWSNWIILYTTKKLTWMKPKLTVAYINLNWDLNK